MNSTVIHQVAELCSSKGIEHVILCPGSRSAPLTLAFLRNNQFNCWTFSDERSAAFIGMAMAQQTRKPVVLVCTSGSAAYNFAPAVAEAFFQKIPLIILTADRPKEWIDQLDGQTIRQQNIYGDHVKQSFELPQEYPHDDAMWYANRIVNEAINLADSEPRGPVHINTPFREPLYSMGQERNTPHNPPRKIDLLAANQTLAESQWGEIVSSIGQFQKALIVSGQGQPDASLNETLREFQKNCNWPIACDILSNLHGISSPCAHADTFLGQIPEKLRQSLAPDLLITFGQSLVAKNLKLFLRKHPPRQHWHIQAAGKTADTFQNLTRIIPTTPQYFFSELTHRLAGKAPKDNGYHSAWQMHENKSREAVNAFFDKHDQGEFSLLHKVMASLPENCNLHLANSMSVRYANHIGLTENQKGVHVYSNRGTSGIDGCTSTAVGHALTSTIPNVLITGDQAFFYDRNAFWHNYPIPNLFVVVLNNHGGIIFNMIDGPEGLPEAEEFFITRQSLKAKSLANEFSFSFQEGASVGSFFKPDGNVKIMEIESSQSLNKSVFESFRKQIKKNYEA